VRSYICSMHTWSTSSTPANLILYIVCQPLPKGKKGTWYEQVKDLAPIIGTFGNTRNYLGVTVKKRNYLGVAEGTKCMQGTSTSHQPIACNGCSENGAVMCRSRSITSPTFYSEMPSPQWINMARMYPLVLQMPGLRGEMSMSSIESHSMWSLCTFKI
jgi:hypothetical protein